MKKNYDFNVVKNNQLDASGGVTLIIRNLNENSFFNRKSKGVLVKRLLQ